jgi:hypothetical protein
MWTISIPQSTKLKIFMASEVCKKPPEGWRCTREADHDGPCAAHPIKNMHDRDLDALIKDRPPTEFEKHMHDLEVRRLEDLAQRIKGNTELAKSQRVAPDVNELLGRQAWSLKCLLQDISRAAAAVSEADRRVNATLAVRHLEDALHRIKLALEP